MYGKSSQDIFEFQGGSDGEINIRSRTETGHRPRKRKRIEHPKGDQAASRRGSQEDVTRKPFTSSGGETDLLSTNLNPHETSTASERGSDLQNSMAPPASKSTVFNQSQRSQTEKIVKVTDLAHSEFTTSSVISSDGEKYTETRSHDPVSAPTGLGYTGVDGECPQSFGHSVEFHSTHSNEANNRNDLDPSDEPAPSPSASTFSPSKTISVRRTNQAKGASEKLTSHSDSEHLDTPLDHDLSATSKPVVLLPRVLDIEGARDELSLSIPEAASKNATEPAKALQRSMETDNGPVDELGFEDDIGIPKERYQPRPSKRRSGAGDGEILIPADFSKRPEAIGKGKRKTKRHKTTAFQELLPPDEDEDEDIKVVPNPRFDIPEKKGPQMSAEEDRPYVEKTDCTDQMRPANQPEPQQAAQPTGQKKRGRPKKVVTNLSEETVVNETEGDHDQDNTETEEPIISATAKKSRQRTKTKEIPTSIIDDQNNHNDDTPPTEHDPENPPPNILIDSTNNINLTAKPPSSATSPEKDMPPPETPRKPTTPAPNKGPDKHSPISSGKVAYRVGLSKRARIAPLLTIVRK